VAQQAFIAHTESGDISGVHDGDGFPLLLLHG
jgi:hypothetical protein